MPGCRGESRVSLVLWASRKRSQITRHFPAPVMSGFARATRSDRFLNVLLMPVLRLDDRIHYQQNWQRKFI